MCSSDLVARAPVSVPAPVVPGQVIGQVCAYLDGVEVAAADMVAAAPSARREAFSPIVGLPLLQGGLR